MGEKMSYCKKCGEKLEEGIQYCPECGTPVQEIHPETLKYYKEERKRAKTHNWFKNSAMFLILAIVFLIILLMVMTH